MTWFPWLLAGSALVLAACDGEVAVVVAEPQTQTQTQSQSQSDDAENALSAVMAELGVDIPPPLPQTVTRLITRADDGERIALAVGDVIAVALVGTPTAGMTWRADETPAFLTEQDTVSGPTRNEQLRPDWSGGNHWQVHVFSVDAPGEGRLAMGEYRLDDTDEPFSAFAFDLVSE